MRPADLNYHHLMLFWSVAREGSLTRASARLGLAPATVSAQLRALEEALEEPLFDRQGRRLVPTEAGRVALGYCDGIFGLGRELLQAVRGGAGVGPVELRVGVASVLPKLVAKDVLLPVFELDRPVRVVAREDSAERLVASLAVHELDLVLSDAPVGLARGLRLFTHALGASAVAIYAARDLAAALGVDFPLSLDGARVLLPGGGTTLRPALDGWFAGRGLRPEVVGEFEDSALLKAFAQAGVGAIAAAVDIEAELRGRYGLERVGLLDGLEERVFAVTAERAPAHPAVRAVLGAATGRPVFTGARRTRAAAGPRARRP